MPRFLVFLFVMFGVAGMAVAEDLSPDAQKVMRMVRAGVDESVVIAYLQTQNPPLEITTGDVKSVRASGASANLIAAFEAARARWSVRSVTEAQMYRLYDGLVIHNNRTYDYGSGLPQSLRLDLESDETAKPSIEAFSKQQGIAQTMTWTGLGLVLGGIVYAGVAQATVPSQASLNNGIGLAAVTTGVLSLIFQEGFRISAYRNLYTGLYQYNSDLVNGKGGGNS